MVDDPFLDPAALIVFGSPGRAALLHRSDGSVILAVEDMEGELVSATLDADAKARLAAALEAPPPRL